MQVIEMNNNKEEHNIILKKISRQFSSSNMNIILGSGFSRPFLDTLADIEKKLTVAIESGNISEERKLKHSFFDKCIKPALKIDTKSEEFIKKISFVRTLCDIIQLRESSTLHKSINFFTTNYDNIIERALEGCQISYFDGFDGRVQPTFSTANYGKLVSKQTNVTGRSAELVSVNLYKLHGSLYWEQKSGDIIFSDFEQRIEQISKSRREDFLDAFSKNLNIINPTKDKFNSTLLNNYYYDQLRMFSNELEKDNTVLLSFGFSFADEHIFQLVCRAIKTNPTLTLIIFPYDEIALESLNNIFDYDNNVISYIEKTDDVMTNFNLDRLNNLIREVYDGIK